MPTNRSGVAADIRSILLVVRSLIDFVLFGISMYQLGKAVEYYEGGGNPFSALA